MKNELRVWLLRSLLNKKLATRDIYHFTLNQARQCIFEIEPDQTTIRAAMNVKVEDIREALRLGYDRRKRLEENILSNINDKSNSLKMRTRRVKRALNRERKAILDTYRKKIHHYQIIQNPTEGKNDNTRHSKEKKTSHVKDNSPTVPPRGFQEFSGLSIFGKASDLPKAEKSLGPYFCDPSIKLTRGELALLSKDPNFSVGFEPNEKQFQVEVQRMLSKHRINENLAESKQGVTQHMRLDHDLVTESTPTNLRRDRLHDIFHEQKNRYIYNPLEKSVGFNKRNASDYKMNKSIKLPKPLSSDKEFECEIKKREYDKAFNKYKSIEKRRNMKKKRDEPINLTREENIALTDIKRKIKNGELYITSTDKSSRFAILNREQYLQAGNVHTSKDKKIGWNHVKYLQSQVNAHMWWLAKIVGYSKDTNPARMNRNIQGSSMEVPEMVLLVKDHKCWNPESKDPVPTRPVMSGNKGINSHLSEWLSEILEPIALNMASAEVNSTEEVLAKIDELNSCLDQEQTLQNLDPLTNISIFADREYRPELELEDEDIMAPEIFEFNAGTRNDNNTTIGEVHGQDDYIKKCDLDKRDDEENLIEDILFDLGMDALRERQDKASNRVPTPIVNDEEKKENQVSHDQKIHSGQSGRDFLQTNIKNFFTSLRGNSMTNDTVSEQVQCQSKENIVFNKGLEKHFNASSNWARREKKKWKKLLPDTNAEIRSEEIFDVGSTPVLLGADVKTLYPSLCPMGTAEMAAQAVKKTKVSFKGFDFKFLIVYLFLILGATGLKSLGLNGFIPVKKERNCNSRSLIGKKNRSMDNWEVDSDQLSEKNKTDMIAAMIKLSTIVLMKTTCYSFGGQVYLQNDGAGIGLRASAALARIVMCTWDQRWSYIMKLWKLPCKLFIRYVDDIRVYVNFIKRGWRWSAKGWTFDIHDDRDPVSRTLEELNKSFDSVLSFLSFTTEWEGEFTSGFLPTLDMETKVKQDGKITYRFFRKPTCNNIVLQNGSCLPKILFSALSDKKSSTVYYI